MRKRYTAEQREKLIAEVRATGERAGVVAKRMGVTPSTAYLWMKTAAPVVSAPVFARVVPTRSREMAPASRMVLEVGSVKLHVERDFDPALLRQVIAALSASSSSARACRSTWRSSRSTCGWAMSASAAWFGSGCGPSRVASAIRVRGQARAHDESPDLGRHWAIVVHKKLDAGKFELPKPTREGDQHVIVSDAIFEVIYQGVSTTPKARPPRVH